MSVFNFRQFVLIRDCTFFGRFCFENHRGLQPFIVAVSIDGRRTVAEETPRDNPV